MISQATVDVSNMLPLAVIVKDVPATLAVTSTEVPIVPDVVCLVRNILEFAVTAVVFTTTVPATSVATPTDAFDPSVMFILLPAIPNVKLPFIVSESENTNPAPAPTASKVTKPDELTVVLR